MDKKYTIHIKLDENIEKTIKEVTENLLIIAQLFQQNINLLMEALKSLKQTTEVSGK